MMIHIQLASPIEHTSAKYYEVKCFDRVSHSTVIITYSKVTICNMTNLSLNQLINQVKLISEINNNY